MSASPSTFSDTDIPRIPGGPALPPLHSRHILGMRVDATSYDDACERVLAWSRDGSSHFVCASSVNNVIEANDDPDFCAAMNRADLVTPDGMPLVWGLKLLGVPHATRTYGPTLTELLLERAAEEGIAVGFYGGSPEVLAELETRAGVRWPTLDIAYSYSPPFRPPTEEESTDEAEAIAASGAKILFIGLGTPKQDLWMDRNKGTTDAVMLGVGAAFDFLAGHKKQAPALLQRVGLEWLFRLMSEPRRLWRRYLYRNPRFVLLFAVQLIKERLRRS